MQQHQQKKEYDAATAKEADVAPSRIPAEFIRYAVALEAPELAWGYLHSRLTAEATVELAFLRRCDLGERGEVFARIHARGRDATPALHALCQELVDDAAEPHRIWHHLALAWRYARPEAGAPSPRDALQLAAGRDEFLLARAASGRAMNWQNSSALLGTDRPEEVDAAFDRGEELLGVALIGLALTHPDAAAILPRVARTLEHALTSDDARLRHQSIVALAHTARLHRTIDQRCLALLRRCPRGSEADMDVWGYVPHRRLPLWLWRHQFGERARWLLRDRWRRRP
ncbi:hypothetical protein FCH28_06075 [Streptomyces piniterrae]|uniref:Uncharacterized protein n=1 Tax=Streptomyces piniterrae TaxID=2571125 RepID=A0A4V5MLG2_9ACTN|nr:hypothetical protein [Streptomyces piniterrae]TJZ57038.1 hypothetical protein FCH28_06075 [Streptomyces piniterrae]